MNSHCYKSPSNTFSFKYEIYGPWPGNCLGKSEVIRQISIFFLQMSHNLCTSIFTMQSHPKEMLYHVTNAENIKQG